MSCVGLVARKGREKQRYQEHFRLVSGCIPYKLIEETPVEHNHSDDLLNRLRVVMISTPTQHDFVFPKGGWENDETDEEAACREALEEAGVRGVIRGELGVWDFRSKSKQNMSHLKGWCRGTMFALEVNEEMTSWPEQDTYERKWLTVKEAWEVCRYDWMREALKNCMVFLSGKTESTAMTEIPEPSISTSVRPLTESSSKDDIPVISYDDDDDDDELDELMIKP